MENIATSCKRPAEESSTIAVATSVARGTTHAAHSRADSRARTGGDRRVGAEHADAGAELGSTKRNYVLADMSGNDFAMLHAGVGEDVLNQVVAVLVAGNVNQGDTGAVDSTLAHTVEVATEKVATANLEALLDNFGGVLISAILGSVTDDVVNSTRSIGRGTMLANVLDAPVAELAMSDDVNIGKDLLNAGALDTLVSKEVDTMKP